VSSRPLRLKFAVLSMWVLGIAGANAQTSGTAQLPILVQDNLPSQGGRYEVNYIKVLRNGIEQPTPVAHIGDTVSLGVRNLGCWIQMLMEQGIIPKSARMEELQKTENALPPGTRWEDSEQVRQQWNALAEEVLPVLRLYMAGHVMGTVRVSQFLVDVPSWYAQTDLSDVRDAPYRTWVEFDLVRDATNQPSRADWSNVLTAAGLDNRLPVSIAVYQQNRDTAHVIASFPGRTKAVEFRFQRFPTDWPTIIGIALLVLAFVLFLYWAFNTGIIRDSAQNVCPDGLPPFSLGRCQMAFWFFVVIATFYFLWLVTGRGDTDTINGTVLTLIGISAGTALGSAVISQNQAEASDDKIVLSPVIGSAPPPLPVQIRQLRKQLAEANQDLKNKTGDALTTAQTDIQIILADLHGAEVRLKKFKKNRLRQLLMDILSDNESSSDPLKNTRIITFHRFQIVVWTLVLGIIFISQVVTRLGMPTLDPTLLTLMGISSGTYLGFKLPSTPVTK
jgi:hypothetical protein